MKTRSEIIAEQESIGNVEITQEKYNNLFREGEFQINFDGNELYFAPRDVIYPDEKIGCGKMFYTQDEFGEVLNECEYENLCPSCQKKKDNHNQQQGSGKLGDVIAEKIPENLRSIPAEDIQSSKVFEDVIKLIDEKLKDYHKRLEDGRLPDLTQANISGMILGIEDLKSKLKEKWGKIE